MASLVLRRANRLSPFLQRWASAAAATVPLSDPVPHLGQEKAPVTRKAPEEVRVSHLSNGITVASLENYSHHSNVSVFVKAGSRYETYNQRGLTHLLRNCAFLASGERSTFGIAREMDAIGSSLTATTTREHLIYSSEFLRDKLATTTREHLIYSSEFLRDKLGFVVDTLGTVVSAPKFQPWEVKDKRPSLELDIATYEAQPNSVLFEDLHSAAFRNALSNPLFCPTYNVSKLTSQDLNSYVEEWFTGRRIAVVGVGVNHSELVQHAEASFSGIPEGMTTTDSPSEYVGGAEVRIPTGSSLCYAAAVCKGASLANPKDVLAAGVLQHVLGASPGYVKWGSNAATARLGKVAAGTVNAPFLVTALNMNYSDNGLFGVYTVSDGSITGKLLKAVMKEFSEVAKGSVTDADLSRAKNQLKASYLMNCETQSCLVEDLGVQALLKGSYTALEETLKQVDSVSKDDVVKALLKGSYTALEETLKQVDSVSKDDVVKFARAVFGTRATFVALGNLSSTPRLDHLLADLSLR